MKKLLAILITILVVASLTLTVACNSDKDKSSSGSKPQQDNSTYHYEDVYPALTGYALPEDPEDTEALKLLACALYNKANELAQKCDHRYAASTCIVKSGVKMGKTIMGASVTEMIYVIKSGTEYYKLDYQPSLKAWGATLAQGHGKATYASMALDKAYYVQASDSEKVDDGYHADFSDPQEIKWVDRPYFNAEQEIKYTETEMGILPETIKTVIVTHNDEEGYWHIELDLDTSNPKTTEIPLPKLRSNDETKDATYESIYETIEIWDNGMYKLFYSMDNWDGSIAGTIDYKTEISYSAAMCDLSQYEFFADIKEAAQNADPDFTYVAEPKKEGLSLVGLICIIAAAFVVLVVGIVLTIVLVKKSKKKAQAEPLQEQEAENNSEQVEE